MSLILSGTSGLSDVDGSAATPAIRGTDTNTGIFFPAADTIAFAEGGAEIARFDSSGNFGIGTTTPGAKLEVNDATRASVFVQDSAGRRLRFQSPDSSGNPATVGTSTNHDLLIEAGSSGAGANTMRFNTAGSERMRLDASGNLGIGTTSPTNFGAGYANLEVNGTTTGVINVSVNGTRSLTLSADGAAANIQSRINGLPLTFSTNGGSVTERMRIDSSGNLLVGTTDAGATSGNGVKIIKDRSSLSGYNAVSVVSNANNTGYSTYELYTATGGAGYKFYVAYNGTISAVSTTISSLSDQRHKENIRDLDVGLDKIMALKPRLYDWKEGKGANIKNARGFIAQEFEQVFPDLIDEWKDPAPEGEEPYKSVRADLIPVLVKAIQELKDEFDAYKLTHP